MINLNVYTSKAKMKLCTTALATALIATNITSCGNKQILDFNKEFNIAIEANGEVISLVGIAKYSDYDGNQVQFITEDGLVVLTSSNKTQLLNATNNQAKEYAETLNHNQMILDYDELQGNERTKNDGRNKKFFDFNYTYDKAMILNNGYVTVVKLEQWCDYSDDKLQLKLSNGICILTHADQVKLLNSDNADEDSIKNYALSLVGDEQKISYYSFDTEKQKTK